MTTSNVTHDQSTQTKKEPSQTKSPQFIAYQVRKTRDGKGFWTRIGAAWMHEDKAGLNIQLESLPVDGAITLRLNSEKVH